MTSDQKNLLIENSDWISEIMLQKFGSKEKALNHVIEMASSYEIKDDNCNTFWNKIEKTLKTK